MKILIAGLGSIGRRHLRNLIASVEAGHVPPVEILLLRSGRRPGSAVKTPDAKRADELLANFAAVTSIEEALDWKPHAVIASNPTALHLDIAIPAAEAGCHLLLEKPVSHNMQRIDLLLDAVKKGSGQVLVGYQFRFHPGLQKIHQLLQAGAIGQPLSFHAQWSEWLPGWHPWEDYRQGYSARQDLGGGVILTLSHPLDYLVWLLGEVESLWAYTSKNDELGTDVEDNAEIGIQFKNGTIGSVHLDYNGQPPAHRLEIIGNTGTISWDNTTGTVNLFQAGTDSQSEDLPGKNLIFNSAASGNWQHFHLPGGYDRNDLFVAEVQHFISLVRRDSPRAIFNPPETLPQPCSLEDGIYVLKICLAALHSSQTGNLQRIQ